MERAQQLVAAFRDRAPDSDIIGFAGLRAKTGGVVVADQAGALHAKPYAIEVDGGDETYALYATHPTHGRRVAALFALARQWPSVVSFDVVTPRVAVDTGRIAMMSGASAAALRELPHGEAWLAKLDGPPTARELELPNIFA